MVEEQRECTYGNKQKIAVANAEIKIRELEQEYMSLDDHLSKRAEDIISEIRNLEYIKNI